MLIISALNHVSALSFLFMLFCVGAQYTTQFRLLCFDLHIQSPLFVLSVITQFLNLRIVTCSTPIRKECTCSCWNKE